MKVLWIYDDIWHPAEVIDRGLKSFPDRWNSYEIDRVCTAKDILTPGMLKEYPVILCAKGNAINAANSAPWFEEGVTEVMPGDFREYIENGGGFVSLHASNTFMTETCPEMTGLIGCSYVSHPPRCLTKVYPVSDHPVNSGVAAFEERDEHYILDYNCKDMDVFLKSSSKEGGERIAGYTRQIGKGRLCALTPGHTLALWQNPNFQTLVMNAIDWCAGLL